MRTDNRSNDELRPVRLVTDYMGFADGSALIELGKTKVIATASVEERVPFFLKNSGSGWITAEYSMLPRATEKRTPRERNNRLSGRTQEIQRLIGRALRSVTDLIILGERTIIIDCDVIQADGGTRTASITAACVALGLSLKKLLDQGTIPEMPLRHLAAAISVGIVDNRFLLDLDYREDAEASVDMNVVETDTGHLVEVQATAEKSPLLRKDFDSLLELAHKGIREIIRIQKEALKEKSLLFMAYGDS